MKNVDVFLKRGSIVLAIFDAVIVLRIAYAVAVTLTACSSSCAVELYQGGCHGLCPSYSIKVRDDGLVQYQGYLALVSYEHGRNLTEPFIRPWDYDPHHQVKAWLFYEYTDRRFVESGLGPSLAQALLFAKKEPLTALQEQVGRNLSALFFGWLDWRYAPGFRYAAASLQVTAQLSLSDDELARLSKASEPDDPYPYRFLKLYGTRTPIQKHEKSSRIA